MTPALIGAADVARLLPMAACIPLMREAMVALSTGKTRQPLRQIVDLGGGDKFGAMPGAWLGETFGAKLVSVFPGNVARGGLSHQGVVALFDPVTGAPSALVDAGELTAIRTAAASAAATDVLARPDASRLAVLGTGEQAARHIAAIRLVRPIAQIVVWGRNRERAEALGERVADTPEEAVRDADIVCTVSAAADPILFHVAPGTHINAVGSSHAGPSEIAEALVARARFFADHREGVLAQGAEFLRAKAAGLIDDTHILGEIGEVMAGSLPGRTSPDDVTLYKSLGSIVQDLAAARHIVAAWERERG